MPKKKAKKSAPANATAAPAETAEKPSAPAGDKPTASDFIRSLPVTMPVSAVVKEGAARGYSFSPTLVYMARKPKKGDQKAGKVGRPKGSKSRKAAPSKASAAPVHAPVAAPTHAKTAGDKLSASDFIRSLPLTMPVKEVIAKAGSEGYSFSTALVNLARSRMKKGSAKAGKVGRPKAMPVAKKNGPNKSDFVRSQPFDLPAADVVAKAKEAGLTITSALVYKVRGKQKAKAATHKKAVPDQAPAHAPVHAPVAAPAHAKPAGDKPTAPALRMFNVETAVQKILSDSISAIASQIAQAVQQGLAAAILGASAPTLEIASATASPVAPKRRGRPPGSGANMVQAVAAPAAVSAPVAKAGKTTRRKGRRHLITQAELDAVLTVMAKKPGLTSVQLQKAAGIDGKQAGRVLSKLRETKKVHLTGSRSKATYTVA